MIGCDIDRGGPKDSETAPNSFLTKCSEKGFWRFVPDMILKEGNFFKFKDGWQ